MTTSITSAPASATGISLSKVSTTLRAPFAAWRMWRAHREACALLGTMSDRELQDIGIARSEITHAVERGRAHIHRTLSI